MVARVLDFYLSALTGIEDTLRAYEDEVSGGLKIVSQIDARIKSLRERENALRSDLTVVQVVRERRTFDGQVEGLIQEILSGFSTQVSALQSAGVGGRALTMEISRATDEAKEAFASLKTDLIEYHHPAESDLEPLFASVDAAAETVSVAKTRLLATALAPGSSSTVTTMAKHGSAFPERRPSDQGATTPAALRQTRALSLSSGSLPPSPTSPITPKLHSQQPLSLHSRESSTDQTPSSTGTEAPPKEIQVSARPTWESWPRRKEDEAEYATGLLNLQEIENDLRDVEERIEVTHGESRRNSSRRIVFSSFPDLPSFTRQPTNPSLPAS